MEKSTALYEMLKEGLFTDAKIMTKDGEKFAHKNILALESGFFRAAFTTALGDRDFVDLSEMSGTLLDILMEFIYLGKLELTDANVYQVYIAADYLIIDSITELCTKYLVSKINADNCIYLLRFARLYSNAQLQQAAWQFLLLEITSIQNTNDFLNLPIEDIVNILQSDHLNVTNEEKAWEIALTWIQHKPERQGDIMQILSSIRLGLLDQNYFIENVRKHPIVMNQPECHPILTDATRLLFSLDMPDGIFEENPIEFSRPRFPREIVLAIGGWSGGSPTNCIEAYDIRSDRWNMVVESDPKGPRAYHGTAVIGNDVYMIGGYNGLDYYNSCRCFNVVTKKWREVGNMNRSRCYVSVAVCDGIIYAMGGFNGQRRQNTAEKYDPRTNQWTLIADMHSARSDANAATLNGKVYIVGGFNGSECLSSAEEYDPQRNEWRNLPNMSSRRSGVSCTAFDKHIYVMGGFNGGNRLASGEKYNPANNTWSPVREMLRPRSNFSTAVIDGCLMVIGGFNGTSTTSDVESFHPNINHWSAVASLNVQRSALSACVVCDIPNVEDFIRPQSSVFRTNSIETIGIEPGPEADGQLRVLGPVERLRRFGRFDWHPAPDNRRLALVLELFKNAPPRQHFAWVEVHLLQDTPPTPKGRGMGVGIPYLKAPHTSC